MCSVSWQRDEAGLFILFNRDERKSREEAFPPSVIEQNGRKILRPVDSEKGGTWFAVNQFGLAVGLLNNYRELSEPPENPRSRGQLVMEIAGAEDLEAAEAALHFALETGDYPPFTLLVWHGDEERMWDWAGDKLSFTPHPKPLVTSSSWESERVETWRKTLYREKVENGNWDAVQFHRYEVPGDEASSVCMSRESTQTVSLTTCRITGSEAVMTYSARDREGRFTGEITTVLPVNLLL